MSSVIKGLGKDIVPIDPAQLIIHLAQAEAALMVLESLMNVLLEQKVLSKDKLIDAVETVIETKRNMVIDHEHAPIAAVAAGLLSTFANSLAANKSAAV